MANTLLYASHNRIATDQTLKAWREKFPTESQTQSAMQ